MLGGGYGDPKTPIWPLPFTDVSDQQVLSIGHGLMGFAPTPVGASECCAGCANVAKARDGRERAIRTIIRIERLPAGSPMGPGWFWRQGGEMIFFAPGNNYH